MTGPKHAWMRLSEHHMPHMKGMELGKRYHIHAEIEPAELSTGENEYNMPASPGMAGKAPKQPMTGRFKVHVIHELHQKGKAPSKGKEHEKKGKKDSAAEEKKESPAERRKEGDAPKGRYVKKKTGRY